MTFNIGMSAGTIPRTKGSRSQLATNRFLLVLSQVFATNVFTSRDVAARLGLDFLNTAKKLSRMSGRYLLSARRVPRQYGGYENVYAISPKGWRKIAYLQLRPVEESARDLWQEASATGYLLTGKGKLDELLADGCFHTWVDGLGPQVPVHLPDQEGLFLAFLNPIAIPFEAGAAFMDGPFRTMLRAMYLQNMDLIPQDIDLAQFVTEAYRRGSSGSAILFSLLIRGGLKLRNELGRMKRTHHTRSSTKCEICHLNKVLCGLQEYHIQQCQDQISSLRRELDDSRLENFKLTIRNRKLKTHIVDMGPVLRVISKGLDEFQAYSLILTPMKLYIRTALLGIALLNYFACS